MGGPIASGLGHDCRPRSEHPPSCFVFILTTRDRKSGRKRHAAEGKHFAHHGHLSARRPGAALRDPPVLGVDDWDRPLGTSGAARRTPLPAPVAATAPIHNAFMDDTTPEFGWTRRWLPFHHALSADSSYGEPVKSVTGEGSTLDELADIPCVVLLGAPGTGKTRDARRAVAWLRASSTCVDFVQAGRANDLGATLVGLLRQPRGIDWQAGRATWHVFIDGVDEAPGGAPGFEDKLRSLLDALIESGGPIAKLRLRLLCRTAEWTESLEQSLGSLWVEAEVKKLQISPLLEADVREAVQVSTGDSHKAASFLESVKQLRIEALASRPVSLKLLIELFIEFGNLPRRQAELYQRGLQALLAGSHRGDPTWARRGAVAIDERMTVAARIAAVSAFSGTRSVWTGSGTSGLPTAAARLSALTGGYEPAPPTSFPVGEIDVLDIVRSPLFEQVGPDIYAWSHQTFMEFLAARYLTEHGLTPSQIHDLLSVRGPTDAIGIAPQLREIAAWVATTSPDYFRLLLDSEPDVLLQSDVAAAAPEQRELLVGELLERFDAGEFFSRYTALAQDFGRLGHPGLAEQLRRFINAPDRSMFARRVAIDMVERCNVTELAPFLAAIALSEGSPISLRVGASNAVRRLGDEQAKAALVQVLRSDLASDTQDELKGSALLATWPKHLPVAELLPLLDPRKDPGLVGSYALFLYRLEVPALSPEEAATAIEWVAQRREGVDEEGASDRATLASAIARVLWAAAAQAGSPVVRERLSDLVISALGSTSTWPFEAVGREGTETWPGAELTGVVKRVLEKAADPPDVARMLTQLIPGLVRSADARAYLRLLIEERQASVRKGLAIIVAAASKDAPTALHDEVFEASESVEELADTLKETYYIELDSQRAQWMRAAMQRTKSAIAREQSGRVEATKVDEAVRAGLRRIEAGDVGYWWQLNLLHFVSSSGRFEGQLEFQSDLTSTTVWRRLSSEDHARLVEAAHAYLRETPLQERRWIGSDTHHRPAAAGFRALRLLHDRRPEYLEELTPQAWNSWAPAAVTFFDNGFASAKEAQIAIVRRAWEAAPKSVLNTLARMALGQRSGGIPDRVLELLAPIFDDRIGSLLTRLTRRAGFRHGLDRSSVFAFLVRSGHEPSMQEVRARITSPAIVDDADAGAADVVAGAAELLKREPRTTLPLLLQLRRQNPQLAKAVWTKLAAATGVFKGEEELALPEADLAVVHLELASLFPPESESDARSGRFLSAVDHVQQFQENLLRRLVSRGTGESLAALERIAVNQKADKGIRLRLEEARWNFRAAARQVLTAEDVVDTIGRLGIKLPPRDEITALRASIRESVPEAAARVPNAVETISAQAASREEVRQLTIAAVATEWHSGHGGVSTVNRELCAALAGLGHKVFCIVPNCDENDKRAAIVDGVRLVQPPDAEGIEDIDRLLLVRSSHFETKPDIVIGHDHVTGPYALQVAIELGAKYVHMLHTVPQEAEGLKSRASDSAPRLLRGNEKGVAQRNLSLKAQLVVAIGPKIAGNAMHRLGDEVPVHTLMPGLNKRLLEHVPNPDRLRRIHCLLTARMQDAELKGARLGCEAVRRIALEHAGDVSLRPRLVLRGFSPESQEAEFSPIGRFEDFRGHIEGRAYTEDSSEIYRDIRESSLVVMPSLSEGFGLTAYEAIAAGVPVIVSVESGLAEYLLSAGEHGRIDPSIAELCVAQVLGDNAQVVADWVERISHIFADRHAAFQRARELRAALVPVLTWEAAARDLTVEMLKLL